MPYKSQEQVMKELAQQGLLIDPAKKNGSGEGPVSSTPVAAASPGVDHLPLLISIREAVSDLRSEVKEIRSGMDDISAAVDDQTDALATRLDSIEETIAAIAAAEPGDDEDAMLGQISSVLEGLRGVLSGANASQAPRMDGPRVESRPVPGLSGHDAGADEASSMEGPDESDD